MLEHRAGGGYVAHFADGVVLKKPDGLRCHIEVRDIADRARVTRNRLQDLKETWPKERTWIAIQK
jgi:hypothetical protein